MLIEIRDESPGDVEAIREVNTRAFGRDQEANIVDALRSNGAVSLSLVATVDGRVVGHILYSPVSVGPLMGEGLGPMAGARALLSAIRVRARQRSWDHV